MLEKIINQVGGYDYLFYDFILLIPLAIIGIIIAVVIGIKRRKKGQDVMVDDFKQKDTLTFKDEQNTHSLKILRERLAKGEISKEEYNKLEKEFET